MFVYVSLQMDGFAAPRLKRQLADAEHRLCEYFKEWNYSLLFFRFSLPFFFLEPLVVLLLQLSTLPLVSAASKYGSLTPLFGGGSSKIYRHGSCIYVPGVSEERRMQRERDIVGLAAEHEALILEMRENLVRESEERLRQGDCQPRDPQNLHSSY
jgi:hypothetical protein